MQETPWEGQEISCSFLMRFMQTKATSYNSTLFYLEIILFTIYALFLRKPEFYRDMSTDAGPKAEHTQIPYGHDEEKAVSFSKQQQQKNTFEFLGTSGVTDSNSVKY